MVAPPEGLEAGMAAWWRPGCQPPRRAWPLREDHGGIPSFPDHRAGGHVMEFDFRKFDPGAFDRRAFVGGLAAAAGLGPAALAAERSGRAPTTLKDWD